MAPGAGSPAWKSSINWRQTIQPAQPLKATPEGLVPQGTPSELAGATLSGLDVAPVPGAKGNLPRVKPIAYKALPEEEALRTADRRLDTLPAAFHNPGYHAAEGGPLDQMRRDQAMATMNLARALPKAREQWLQDDQTLAAQWRELNEYRKQNEGLLSKQELTQYQRTATALYAQMQKHDARGRQLASYTQRAIPTVMRYVNEPIHTGINYPQEGPLHDEVGSNLFGLNPFGQTQEALQAVKGERALMMLGGQYPPPVPFPKGVRPAQYPRLIDEKNKVKNALILLGNELTDAGTLRPERLATRKPPDPGDQSLLTGAMTPGEARTLAQSLTPWQKSLIPTLRAQIAAERTARQRAGVPGAFLRDLATFGVAWATGGAAAGPAGTLTSRLLAPLESRLIGQGAGAVAGRFLLHAAPRLAAGVAGGAVGGGAAGGVGTLLAGGTLPEAVTATGRGALVGAGAGLLGAGVHALPVPQILQVARQQLASNWDPVRSPHIMAEMSVAYRQVYGLSAAEEASLEQRLTKIAKAPQVLKTGMWQDLMGTLKTRAAPTRPAPAGTPQLTETAGVEPVHEPRITTESGASVSLRHLPPETVAAQGHAAAARGDTAGAEAAARHLQAHAAYEAHAGTPVPIDQTEAFAKAVKDPGNPVMAPARLLKRTAATVKKTDADLGGVLEGAAKDWERDHKLQFLRDQGVDLPPAAPPADVSAWRKLSPEQQAAVPVEVKKHLLVQDVANSLRVLDPETPPIFDVKDVPGRVRRIETLEGIANDLFDRAQRAFEQQHPPLIEAGVAAHGEESPTGTGDQVSIPGPVSGGPHLHDTSAMKELPGRGSAQSVPVPAKETLPVETPPAPVQSAVEPQSLATAPEAVTAPEARQAPTVTAFAREWAAGKPAAVAADPTAGAKEPEPHELTKQEFIRQYGQGSAEDLHVEQSPVAEKGKPGYGIERLTGPKGEGRGLAVVFRDSEGVARGTLKFAALPPELGGHSAGIESVWVDPEMRRQGIGSKLYDTLEQEGYEPRSLTGRFFTFEGASLFHGRAVAKAVAQGQTVPEEVLKDYPKFAEAKAADIADLREVGAGLAPTEAEIQAAAELRQKEIATHEPTLLVPTEEAAGPATRRPSAGGAAPRSAPEAGAPAAARAVGKPAAPVEPGPERPAGEGAGGAAGVAGKRSVSKSEAAFREARVLQQQAEAAQAEGDRTRDYKAYGRARDLDEQVRQKRIEGYRAAMEVAPTTKRQFLLELTDQGKGLYPDRTPLVIANHQAMDSAETGKPLRFTGFRQESPGGRIPATGSFYGVEPQTAGMYAFNRGTLPKIGDLLQGGKLDTLTVEPVSAANPLVIEGGHRELIESLEKQPFADSEKKAIQAGWKQVLTRRVQGDPGYAVLDKAIAAAARRAGFDAVVYRRSTSGEPFANNETEIQWLGGAVEAVAEKPKPGLKPVPTAEKPKVEAKAPIPSSAPSPGAWDSPLTKNLRKLKPEVEAALSVPQNESGWRAKALSQLRSTALTDRLPRQAFLDAAQAIQAAVERGETLTAMQAMETALPGWLELGKSRFKEGLWAGRIQGGVNASGQHVGVREATRLVDEERQAAVEQPAEAKAKTKPGLRARKGAIPIGPLLGQKQPAAAPVQFPTPELEEWFAKNAEPEKPPTTRQKLWDAMTQTGHRLTRVYPDLPATAEFGPVQNALLHLSKLVYSAPAEAMFRLHDAIQGLDPKTEYPLFMRALGIKNLQANVRAGTPNPPDVEALPPGALDSDEKWVDAELAKNPTVQKAVTQWREMIDTTFDDLNQSRIDIGLPPHEMTREDWVHQEIVKDQAQAALAKGGGGGGMKLVSHLIDAAMTREGGHDFKTDPIQAHLKVVADAIRITAENNVIKLIQQQHDKLPQWKAQQSLGKDKASAQWLAGLAGVGGQGLIVSGVPDKVGQMAAAGALPDTAKREWKDVTGALAQNWALNQARAPGTPVVPLDPNLTGRLSDYANYAQGLYRVQPGERLSEAAKVPPGYAFYSFTEGQPLYRAYTIPQALAQEAIDNAIAQITDKDVRKVLVLGKNRNVMLLPEGLAKTLTDMRLTKPTELDRFVKSVAGGAKALSVLNPEHAPTLIKEHAVGSSIRIVRGNPRVALEIPGAIQDMWQLYARKQSAAAEHRAFLYEGGARGWLARAENIGEPEAFNLLAKYAQDNRTAPKKVMAFAGRLVLAGRIPVDRLDELVRYAGFRAFGKDIDKAGGPVRFGAARPDLAEAIGEWRGRNALAFYLSNHMFGAYDEMPAALRTIRDRFPAAYFGFASAQVRAETGLIMNGIFRQPVIRTMLGKDQGWFGTGFGGKGATASEGFLRFMLPLTMLSGLMYANNRLRSAGQEKKEQEMGGDKMGPHLDLPIPLPTVRTIAGERRPGNIIVWDRTGSLPGLTGLLGLDDPFGFGHQILNGKMTLKEAANQFGKRGIDDFLSLSAQLKMPLEIVSGKRLSTGGKIRDMKEYIADRFHLGELYRAAEGLPARGTLGERMAAVAAGGRLVDPAEEAYRSATFGAKDWINAQKGISTEAKQQAEFTPLSSAMFYYKKALAYGDRDGAFKYLALIARARLPQVLASERLSADPTSEDKPLQHALLRMDPLWGMPQNQVPRYLKSLSREQKVQLRSAYDYYRQLAAPRVPPSTAKDLAAFARETSLAVRRQVERELPIADWERQHPAEVQKMRQDVLKQGKKDVDWELGKSPAAVK